MKQYFAYYNLKYITGISHNPTGHAVIERSNQTIKNMLKNRKEWKRPPETDWIMLYEPWILSVLMRKEHRCKETLDNRKEKS